jgi:hypothetical protein
MSGEPLTSEEYGKIAAALANWFESQDLRPGDAGLTMMLLIARLLTQRTRNKDELAEAIYNHAQCLTAEVAAILKEPQPS